jgi:hypothetical protein
MPTLIQMNQNEGEWVIRGQIDTSGNNGTFAAIRGTNLTCSKTATGEYTVVLKNTQALKLVELLSAQSSFFGLAPVTALGTRVSAVTQASNDDISIVIKTSATGGGIDTNLGSNSSINFEVVIRTAKMGNPL